MIKKLPQELINMIAAGEVVERPASVVKELLENAIDANSTKITVEIEDFGKKMIKVLDNGVGMDKENAILAFEQHATSKISTVKDLEQIFSLGFRGEALASISSVSGAMSIDSKTEGSGPVKVTYESGSTTDTTGGRVEAGTSVVINNLFEPIPARKKFLKADNTELKHIVSTFIEIALPHLDIHFELFHNGSLLHRIVKTDKLFNRVFDVFGKTIQDRFYTDITAPDKSIAAVLLKPETGSTKARHQYTYINNRFVKSPLIHTAMKQAYSGFMHRDLKPEFFLFLNIDPKEADINVHPRKLEVKFSNGQEIFRNVHSFVRKTLESKNTHAVSAALNTNQEGFSPKTITERVSTPLSNHSSFSFKASGSSRPSNSRINQALAFTEELFAGISSDDLAEQNMLSDYQPVQYFNTYIVFENKNSELVFIDQHAAAEKIAFDKLIESIDSAKSKPLLVPELVDFDSAAKRDTVVEMTNQLEQIGFKIQPSGVKAVQVTEIPELLGNPDLRASFEELLTEDDELIKEFDQNKDLRTKVSKDLYLKIATIACHGSIRAGQKLSVPEMNQIIRDVQALQPPYHCPHGRPVLWKLPKTKIEHNFSRDL